MLIARRSIAARATIMISRMYLFFFSQKEDTKPSGNQAAGWGWSGPAYDSLCWGSLDVADIIAKASATRTCLEVKTKSSAFKFQLDRRENVVEDLPWRGLVGTVLPKDFIERK